MMSSSSSNLVFKVERCEPELVAPAKPTPHEYKQLSDIDDQESLRYQVPILRFYEHNPSMEGKDPVKMIKKAIAETLVYYYPFAGRLREGPSKKLFVDCTGEGILFIEANADVTFEHFHAVLPPPFPCMDELLYDVPNSNAILNCPLLLIQITRLKCGGFIVATRLNHTISDGFGFIQFMNAVAEIAQGAPLSVLPVWQRTLLNARNPPRVTCIHHEYDQVGDTNDTMIPLNHMSQCSFFFGPTEISTIRKTLPTYLQHCSSFELLSAYIWRLRTMALQLSPEEEVRFLCIVNLRTNKFQSLPSGYYGNAIAFPAALTTAGKLCGKPLGYAIELVKKAKVNMTEDYIKSVASLMVIKGRPNVIGNRSFMISDVRILEFLGEVDFGWGKANYIGPIMGGVGVIPNMLSYFIPFKNREGEKGALVPICLPTPIMERFVVQLDALLKVKPTNGQIQKPFRTL